MKSKFLSEAQVCAKFIEKLPPGWTAYNETAGFDILLVRNVDGAQIGIEAKLSLNAKVLLQIVAPLYSGWVSHEDPDWRAVLVPNGSAGIEMQGLAKLLGVTVIEVMTDEANEYYATAEGLRYGMRNFRSPVPFFKPELPPLEIRWNSGGAWVDRCTPKRCKLPEYVPDVIAGSAAPMQLSEWKIKAIKISIILEKRGHVTIHDFKNIGINRQRWLDMGWIKITDIKGHYVLGDRKLGFKEQHPKNYEQIAADWEKWKPPEQIDAVQEILTTTK